MQLFELSVVILVLVATRYQTKFLIATSSPDEAASSLVEDLVKIVTSCYGDRIDAVGIAGDVPDNLARTLSVQHLVPVALIEATNMIVDDESIEDTVRTDDYAAMLSPYRHKLSVFIVEASTPGQLAEAVLWNIRHTVWQNSVASFFILDRSPGCVNALDFLLVAWGSKLLNAKVMCYYNESGKMIVSYNPFTAKAPPPWQLLEVFSRVDDHPFILFSRAYRENVSICVNLDFEKTNDLAGYEVVFEGKSPGTSARQSNSPREFQYWSENDRIVATIYRTLNGTPVFTGLERWESFFDYVDMRTSPRRVDYKLHNELMTYPREQLGLVIVSQFRACGSQPDTIFPATDIDSQFGLGIIYSTIPFFFKFFVQRPLVSAVLNLIRITCNTNFSNLPRSIAPRIYLFSLLLFAITVQVIYQGHMALLLTTRIPCRNVDTMADVKELGYQRLYDYPSEQTTIKGTDLEKRLVDVYSMVECIEYVKRDSLAVCLWPAMIDILDLAQASDLHISGEIVALRYIAYDIMSRSPLEGRLNEIIGRMAEAGLLSHRDVSRPAQYVDLRLTNIYRNKFRKNNNFQKLNLRELSFAFVILSVGLSCATVTFIAELAIRYKCKMVRRNIANGHV